MQVTNTFQQINDNKLNSINFKTNDVEPALQPHPKQRAAIKTKKADRLETATKADEKKTIVKKPKATVAAKSKATVAAKSKATVAAQSKSPIAAKSKAAVAAKPKKAKVAASRGNKKTVKAVAVPEPIDDVALAMDAMDDVERDSDDNVSAVSDQEVVMEPNSSEEFDGSAREDSLDGVSSSAAIVPDNEESDRFNESLQASSRSQSGAMQSAQINMVDSAREIFVCHGSTNSFNQNTSAGDSTLETIAEATEEDIAGSAFETITEVHEEATAETTTGASTNAPDNVHINNSIASSDSIISSVGNSLLFNMSTHSENISTMETSYEDESIVSNITDNSANMSMLPPANPLFRPPNIFIKQTAAMKKPSLKRDDSVIFVPNAPPEIINISDVSDANSTLNDSNDAYSFSILQTDDSTDDEDYKNEKSTKKRPDPPAWSLRENRSDFIEKQSLIPLNVLDTFFMTHCDVDLTELFPNINPAKTKRRQSSARWNTPPRYSMMPKH